MFFGSVRQKVARKRSGFWLYFSYLFSLFLISVLIMGSGYILIGFVSSLENDSRLVNFASNQMTLAQDILNLSLQLANNQDGDTRLLKNHLNLSLNDFIKNQEALEKRDSDLGLSGKNSALIKEFLLTAEPDFRKLVISAETVKSKLPGEAVVFAAVREMIIAESSFSLKMDKVVSQYELESREKVIYAESLGIVIAAVILGTILFEALFIFWPLSLRITRTISEMERFRLAVENTSDAVVIFNKNGNAIYFNDVFEYLTGFTEYELLGERLESQRFWGDSINRDFFSDLWQQVFIKKEKFLGELRQKNKQGVERDLKLSFFPVLNRRSRVEFLVCILTDITQEKEIDRAKSEFVSLASHQLKSPLSKVKWLTEALLTGDFGKFSQDQGIQLKEVYQSNQRMIDLVNGLLDVSRIELGVFTFEIRAVNVSEIVEAVVSELEPQIKEKNLKITQSLEKNLIGIQSDPKLLRIIFQNLVSNAVKYTPDNGSIMISAAIAKAGKNFGSRQTKQDSLSIFVEDTGVGIPENQKEKVFSKLFRADNVKMTSVEGTGLGLYVVKTITDKAGGEIWFESQENRGTTFFVLLPL